MPAEQHGSTYRTSTGWGIRWLDETGARKHQSGFSTEKKAQAWFWDVERKRLRGEVVAPQPTTLAELVESFLADHVAEANTIRSLRDRLKMATDGIPKKPRAKEREHGMGHIRVDRLDVNTIRSWRKRLPEGSAWQAHKALRQALEYAVRAKIVSENVAKLVPNPEPKRGEVPVFGSWEEIERLAEELPPERRSLPLLVVGTGLRPEEWLALERRDLDLKAGVLHVRRVYTDGRVKPFGKQDGSVRRIPLRRRAVEALQGHPWRLDTPLVYPAPDGSHLNLADWRRREWYTALDSAGLPRMVPYAMRHTFASFAIAAGVSLFYLSRLMGSSVEQIDKTYGHLLPDSEEYLRGLLDTYDSAALAAVEGGNT